MTGYPVADDVYRKIHARWNEVERRLTAKGGCPFDPFTLLRILQGVLDTPAPKPVIEPGRRRARTHVHPVDESGIDLVGGAAQLLDPSKSAHAFLKQSLRLQDHEEIEYPPLAVMAQAYSELWPIQRAAIRLCYGLDGEPISASEASLRLGYAGPSGATTALRNASYKLTNALGRSSYAQLDFCPAEFRPTFSMGRDYSVPDLLLYSQPRDLSKKLFVSLVVNGFPLLATVLKNRQQAKR